MYDKFAIRETQVSLLRGWCRLQGDQFMTNDDEMARFDARKRLIFYANNLIFVVFSLIVYTMSLSAAYKRGFQAIA